MSSDHFETVEKLYHRALDIQQGRRPGLWLPTMWTLALRGHADAMIDLADWLSGDANHLGSPAHNFSPAGLYRRAFRKGKARAAHNLAMTLFNRNNLTEYRCWLRKAGEAGDEAARLQAERFETRLPHTAAVKIRRKRPESTRDQFA